MKQGSRTSKAAADKLVKNIRRKTRQGGVRLKRNGLRNLRSNLTQTASWRHSARAADRFFLKVSRRFR
jgi:hypothetical protein